MVYGTAQRSDASIDIESAAGKGTTIRVLFPAAPADAERSKLEMGAALSTRPLRILVVDDDPIVLAAMLEVLAVSGHLVNIAEGGSAGIQSFLDAQKRGEPFAVVMTDLGMPHTSGREVAAAVKASSPTTPVILLTGWGQRLSENNEIPPFVDRVLNKPPTLYDLRTALAQLTVLPAA
jgi:CheY-like chemotaxis protein